MAYTSARGNVGDRVGEVLLSWLPPRLAPAGATAFDISEFSAPPAGYSGRTAFFSAAWVDDAGLRRAEDLVLRAQADDHQLFTVPDAPRQAEVMQRLGAQGIPVPEVVGIERDAAVLGSPFYVMRRVRGAHRRTFRVGTSGVGPSICPLPIGAVVRQRATRAGRRAPRQRL